MARDKITEYDATASNNTVCGDVNIAENSALPSDMNNFAREIMSHLKEGLGSGTPLYVDQTNNRLGIGTSSPASSLSVASTSNTGFSLEAYNATDSIIPDISMQKSGSGTIGTKSTTANGEALGQIRFVGIDTANNSRNGAKISSYQDASATSGTVPAGLRFDTNGSERMRIDSSGNVGIGTTSPDLKLDVSHGTSSEYVATFQNTADNLELKIGTTSGLLNIQGANASTNAPYLISLNAEGGNVGIGNTGNSLRKLDITQDSGQSAGVRVRSDGSGAYYQMFTGTANPKIGSSHNTDQIELHTGGTERMRIDSSGNLLVGKTSSNIATVGAEFRANGIVNGTRSSDPSGYFNRTTSDGAVIEIRKDNSSVGSIGTSGGATYISGPSRGLMTANAQVKPVTNTGANSDNNYDLGSADARFDDIFATNATINTSDRNEKNTITDSDLGIDFIKRLSPKSYIFNGKTRTHYGLIAQDVETVLTDIGKTGTDFAGFIKSDISEEEDGSEYRYGLRYTEFVAPLIKAVKDQQAIIEDLQARIVALETA